ncbi:MAG: RNA polymerase sigma factor [Ruminococcus sp.]|nr:RNA polymerase sigma factor [Ruminococcus sp.]
MHKKSARPADSIENTIHTYGDMLFRICLITLGSSSDAEDAVQETFIKYFHKKPEFRNEEHRKAWLITVATNRCKDVLRYQKRHQAINIDDIKSFVSADTDSSILEALLTLPEKFKTVLILRYIEDYSIKEISTFIGRTPSAVKMRLQKGRKLLKEKYEKEFM